MLAARMHGYKQPLIIEDVPVPDILPDQVLVRVGGAGMCRSDVQLIDGYFAEALKTKFPITPGHEISGLVSAIGDRVPESAPIYRKCWLLRRKEKFSTPSSESNFKTSMRILNCFVLETSLVAR